MNVLVASPGVPFRPVDAERSTAEAELVARLRDGEVAALGDAYELHHEHVRAFVRRFLGDDDPTSRRLMEEILAKEEEHAEDMRSLIERVGKAGL